MGTRLDGWGAIRTRSGLAGASALFVVVSLSVVVAAIASGAPPASARPDQAHPAQARPDQAWSTGSGAVVAPAGNITHAGRWMTDATGRVVIIHGVNVPSKSLPAYPAALGFGEADTTLLASSGFNAVRLTVERYAVEPTPGHFDDAYVAHVADTVAMLARHGILSLIDFHQDEYGPVFNDNGFPAWMTMTDGLPNLTQVGFPVQYFANPALNRAFDHFWANDIGPDGKPLQVDDAAILAHVAAGLASQPGLLGYEILNEPWPGTQYPTCLIPGVGCPLFDRGALSAYYGRIIPALRRADPNHMIWYEPLSTFNQGIPTAVVVPRDPRLGFAFHDYPLCSAVTNAVGLADQALCSLTDPIENSLVAANAVAYSHASGNALLETEFGATFDTASLTSQLAQYDRSMIPWMFWSYTHYIDPLSAGGALKPPTPGNINHAVLSTLARPYPQLVAGTPTAWSFDPATKVFSFSYSTVRAGGGGAFGPGSETDIAVPTVSYPNGYRVAVRGGLVTSGPNAPVLRVVSASGAGLITVTVTSAPTPGS